MSGGSSVTFADAGIFAVAFCLGNAAALNFCLVDGDGCPEVQRQLDTDFLRYRKLTYLAHFSQAGVAGGNDGRAAADRSTRPRFGKRHYFYRNAYQIGLIKDVIACRRDFAFPFVASASSGTAVCLIGNDFQRGFFHVVFIIIFHD